MASRLALVLIHAIGFSATAVGGWYLFSVILPPVSSPARLIAVMALFTLWLFLGVYCGAGLLLAGFGSGEAEVTVTFLVGLVLGNCAGWSIAGYGGMCFGTAAGLFVGLAVGWLRERASASLLRSTARDPERQICVNCGYDVRASPHRSPECGTV